MATNRLQLDWLGKARRERPEPRILIEDERLSHHAPIRRGADAFHNTLIRGDNLLALKALESSYAGEVSCIFIDPPYNTGSAFAHYDDGVEHSLWLSLVRERVEVLHRLLAEGGSFWVSIDDNEAHYLKVLCDEIFGRRNFVANVVWQKKYTVANDAKYFSDNHDHILVYAKNKESWRPNRLARSDEMNARYSNPDDHPKGVWKATPLHAKSGSAKGKEFSFIFKNGRRWTPPPGTFPRFSEDTLRRMDEANEIWFGRDGSSAPSRKTFLADLANEGTPPLTVWLSADVGHNHEAKTEVKAFNSDDVFSTPKPERLLRRILDIATRPGDLVLDSFAGSGTTGAVAHKMGRRWIMVELGDHCETHIVPRLKKVVDGDDPGGVTEAVGWKGGGGYRYFKLAPSLLEKDQFGQWVISKAYNAEMLAEAMCKHFGFTYAPSDEHYWMHGSSSETDFIYVTTNSLTHDQLRAISDEVGADRTLLICCKAFQGASSDSFDNLTIRKIPGAILDRCEWGKDDYSLKIEALPLIEDESEPEADGGRRRKSATSLNQPTLFDGDDEVEP
ncbi:site-specific DNA-methyltransferase [Mesorhizobium sp. WSM4303]|uniref:site-specific DNA-methyltransferase n=1 Tax=unclassified Mesorhizobium TaxID=325217 RepID=UPI00115C828F|nr:MULTISPECIES: site-specific DNA-methyltransferase [unclassified Mesorhizobium]TRC93532.1 site-specific DNA-methyltransferase [Mesorhizobium sp. WSM4306]TRD01021.1 site-specific DNA-methyltransferase [Mesorhizobium sp. WSM4303]